MSWVPLNPLPSRWPDGFSWCWGTQVQLGGSVAKRGNKAEAPQGTRRWGGEVNPPRWPSPTYPHKRNWLLFFWILLINTCIEALSIHREKNSLFLPPSLLPPSLFLSFLHYASSFPFSLRSCLVSAMFGLVVCLWGWDNYYWHLHWQQTTVPPYTMFPLME